MCYFFLTLNFRFILRKQMEIVNWPDTFTGLIYTMEAYLTTSVGITATVTVIVVFVVLMCKRYAFNNL